MLLQTYHIGFPHTPLLPPLRHQLHDRVRVFACVRFLPLRLKIDGAGGGPNDETSDCWGETTLWHPQRSNVASHRGRPNLLDIRITTSLVPITTQPIQSEFQCTNTRREMQLWKDTQVWLTVGRVKSHKALHSREEWRAHGYREECQFPA